MGRRKKIFTSTFLSSEYGRRLLAGIGDSISSHDDWTLRFVALDDIDLRSLSSFDGFICDVRTTAMAKALRRLKRPVVNLFHINDAENWFPSVRTDHQAVGALAAEHFLDRRFSNFAYCGFLGVGFSDYRRNGFAARLRSEGCEPLVYSPAKIRRQFNAIIYDTIHMEEFRDESILTLWIKSLPRPVGIFCCNDERASQVVSVCHRMKLRVPDDVAVLGVDNDPVVCQLASPQISSIDPNPYAVGCEAVRMLGDLLARQTAGTSNEIRMISPVGVFSRASSETYPVEPRWLSDALCFIRRNATNRITAADVFSHLGYSHTLVQNAFKRKLGTTVQREIAAARLAEARKLLAGGNLPIVEIASRCGFASAEYFCHCYSAAFGHPPSRQQTTQPQHLQPI